MLDSNWSFAQTYLDDDHCVAVALGPRTDVRALSVRSKSVICALQVYVMYVSCACQSYTIGPFVYVCAFFLTHHECKSFLTSNTNMHDRCTHIRPHGCVLYGTSASASSVHGVQGHELNLFYMWRFHASTHACIF